MDLTNRPIPPREQVDRLVAASTRAHGHLCPGQVIGVRMAILGLGLLGYPCPLGHPEIKNVVGVVEIERCLADAVTVATGLRFGRGSMKLRNLGLLAASFLDIPSGRAVRVYSREEARELACQYAQGQSDAGTAQTEAYRVMPDSELFDARWIEMRLDPNEMPGARPTKVACVGCGAVVRSGQAAQTPSGPLCPVCQGQAYFQYLDGEAP